MAHAGRTITRVLTRSTIYDAIGEIADSRRGANAPRSLCGRTGVTGWNALWYNDTHPRIRRIMFKNTVLAILLSLVFPIALFSVGSETNDVPKELDAYLALPDDSFRWEIIEKSEDPNKQTFLVEITSQTWQGIPWKHFMLVAVPNRITHPNHAALILGGSSIGRKPNAGDEFQARSLAEMAGMCTAIILQIPNQPLFGNFYEDALIGETLLKALETEDATWPLLFPMTKSAIRAMDTVQQILKEEKHIGIDRFIVTGTSKRGWTSWLTAASGDQRVAGIIPIVIDTLNMQEQMKYQVETWGAFSPSIHDYTERHLIRLDDGELSEFEKNLWTMIDPYFYRARLTVPKLLIHGSNDPYWTVDAAKFYFDDLPGEKYILTLPNTGHSLEGQQLKAVQTAAVFARKVAAQKIDKGDTLPRLEWKLSEIDKGYKVEIETDISFRRAKLWTAYSATKNFRQAKWTNVGVLEGQSPFFFSMAKPESGHVAFFVELETITEGLPFSLTTQVWRF